MILLLQVLNEDVTEWVDTVTAIRHSGIDCNKVLSKTYMDLVNLKLKSEDEQQAVTN